MARGQPDNVLVAVTPDNTPVLAEANCLIVEMDIEAAGLGTYIMNFFNYKHPLIFFSLVLLSKTSMETLNAF